MAKRKSAADLSQPDASPKPGNTRAGGKQTKAQREAAAVNTAKGRAKLAKQKEEARARGADTASVRWGKLLSGVITVKDLDEEEIARMQVRGADGGFGGRRPAVPSHLVQAFQKEGITRANELFRTAAPRAVKRLLEIADDPDVKDGDAIRALDILLNRGLGKMPETIRVEEKSKWDDALDEAYGPSGTDRTLADLAGGPSNSDADE